MIWRTFLTTFLKVDKDEGGSIELCKGAGVREGGG